MQRSPNEHRVPRAPQDTTTDVKNNEGMFVKESGRALRALSQDRVKLIMNCGTNALAAKKLLDEMCAHSVLPDTETFNAAMVVYNKGRRSDLTLQTFKYMEQGGLSLNVKSFSLAINAAGKVKPSQWEKALDLLRAMEAKGIQPNVISYNASMSACEKAQPSQWEKALDLQIGIAHV